MALPHGAVGLSAVSDGGIPWFMCNMKSHELVVGSEPNLHGYSINLEMTRT